MREGISGTDLAMLRVRLGPTQLLTKAILWVSSVVIMPEL